jgi:hypothetical protein
MFREIAIDAWRIARALRGRLALQPRALSQPHRKGIVHEPGRFETPGIGEREIGA